jgi:hypothetical protein
MWFAWRPKPTRPSRLPIDGVPAFPPLNRTAATRAVIAGSLIEPAPRTFSTRRAWRKRIAFQAARAPRDGCSNHTSPKKHTNV